jgi:hypothetical protein
MREGALSILMKVFQESTWCGLAGGRSDDLPVFAPDIDKEPRSR